MSVCVFISLLGCLFMHLIRSKTQMIQIVHAIQWCNPRVYIILQHFFLSISRTVTNCCCCCWCCCLHLFLFNFIFHTMGIRTKVWWCRNVGKINNINIPQPARLRYNARTREITTFWGVLIMACINTHTNKQYSHTFLDVVQEEVSNFHNVIEQNSRNSSDGSLKSILVGLKLNSHWTHYWLHKAGWF